MAWRSMAVIVGVWLAGVPALAQSDPVAPRLDLSLGAHLAATPDSVCQRDGDVEGCSGQGVVGMQAAVLWRPFDHFGFGPTLAVSGQPGDDASVGNADEHDIAMWRLALEGRYFASARRRSGLYLAAEAGLVFIHETRVLGALDESVTQDGALLGAGLGYTLALPFGLAAGASLRAFWTFMPDDPPALGSDDYEAHAWGTAPWIALAIDASFGFGL